MKGSCLTYLWLLLQGGACIPRIQTAGRPTCLPAFDPTHLSFHGIQLPAHLIPSARGSETTMTSPRGGGCFLSSRSYLGHNLPLTPALPPGQLVSTHLPPFPPAGVTSAGKEGGTQRKASASIAFGHGTNCNPASTRSTDQLMRSSPISPSLKLGSMEKHTLI